MIYEYKCQDCKLRFEIRSTVKDTKPEWPCPECKKPSPKQVSDFAVTSAKGYSPKTSGDVHVGRWADEQWDYQEKEAKKRFQARKDLGTMAIEKDSNNEYVAISKEKQEVRESVYKEYGEYVKKLDKKEEKAEKPYKKWKSHGDFNK